MDYETISCSIKDTIATITLDRPEHLNAFTFKMMREMVDVLDRLDADDSVRAIIVTGEGRAFCAGADLADGGAEFDAAGFSDSPIRPDGTLDYAKQSARDIGGILTLRLFRCLKPVIAAINGAAVGVGVTMTLAMDVRIASEHAKFGFVFARRGLAPESACGFFLPRIVGISQAVEWCYSGRIIPAAEARSANLVKAVVPKDDLLPAARKLALEMTQESAPISVALTRQMLWRGLGMAHPIDAHRVDSRAILSRGRSGDFAEGMASFLEKRPARFPDRVSTDMPDFFPWWDEQPYS